MWFTSINSSNDSFPSRFLSIWRNILSVLFSGVDSSSGIFITEPTFKKILEYFWWCFITKLLSKSLYIEASLKLVLTKYLIRWISRIRINFVLLFEWKNFSSLKNLVKLWFGKDIRWRPRLLFLCCWISGTKNAVFLFALPARPGLNIMVQHGRGEIKCFENNKHFHGAELFAFWMSFDKKKQV